MDTAHPRVLLVEDHVLVAQALELLLLEFVGTIQTVHSGEDLLSAVDNGPPDLVIADLSLPGLSGLDALRSMRKAGQTVPFLVLSMHADPTLVLEALCSGAQGYVLKSDAGEDLIRAIREVLAGRTYISASLGVGLIQTSATERRRKKEERRPTDKQLEVLKRLACGMRCKEIAFELGLSVRTVESHKHELMLQLDVHNTMGLINAAVLAGYVPAMSLGSCGDIVESP